jgi:hypothetical protein
MNVRHVYGADERMRDESMAMAIADRILNREKNRERRRQRVLARRC